MIARPLDLASRLRPAPRSLDYVFFINVALIVAFFIVHDSRYIVSPGLTFDLETGQVRPDPLQVPELPTRGAGAVTSYTLMVRPNHDLIDLGGKINPEDLAERLKAAAEKSKDRAILIIADVRTPLGDYMRVAAAAQAAGFRTVVMGANTSRTEAK